MSEVAMSEQGGESRRGFLKCMSWAGTGLVWTQAGGVPASVALEAAARPAAARPFSFVQISDSRVGFSKPFAPHTRVTFREAVAKIAAMPVKPDFILHTGDVSQLSKPADKLRSVLGVREVSFIARNHPLPVTDQTLA
jgi:hypothetical protein